jgi:hypothetical protein
LNKFSAYCICFPEIEKICTTTTAAAQHQTSSFLSSKDIKGKAKV